MNEIKPTTLDDINAAPHWARMKAKQEYAEWRDKVRKEEKILALKLECKINYFKNREKQKKYIKKKRYSLNKKCPFCGKLIYNTSRTCKKCLHKR